VDDEAESRGDASRRVAEALASARSHARRSGAEAALALRCLLEAGALAASGREARQLGGTAALAGALEQLAAGLGAETGLGASLTESILDALETEIGRWETRAGDDPEARAVLRAFLGVREILWELGVRRPARPEEAKRGGRAHGTSSATRVRRVPLDS
jgi:hypothetical protein